MRKILIIGPSKTGKTVAANKLASAESVPTAVVNDITEAAKKRFGVPPGSSGHVEWADVSKLKSCCLLVEDILSCDAGQLKKIKKVLNFSCHHSDIRLVLLVAHSVTSTGVFALLQNLSHVLFMRSRATVDSLARVLSQYRFSKEEQRRMVEEFVADCSVGQWGYWTLDVQTGEFTRPAEAQSDKSAASDAGGIEQYEKAAREYIGLFCPQKEKALAIFRFIVRKIPLATLSSSDLTLKLWDKKEGKERTLSLVDYVHCVTTQGQKPSKDVMALHRYISAHAEVPECFFSNDLLKRKPVNSKVKSSNANK